MRFLTHRQNKISNNEVFKILLNGALGNAPYDKLKLFYIDENELKIDYIRGYTHAKKTTTLYATEYTITTSK